MTILFADFINIFFANPVLMLIIIMTLGVIILNGWVDAPNTIFTCVSAGSVTTRTAIVLSSIFNFFGVFVMTLFCSKVSVTISHLVNFGSSYKNGLIALSAALVSIVLWTVVANRFKLPTSETHALVSGITGAAIFVSGGVTAINPEQWVKVLYGIVISLVVGFTLAWAVTKLIKNIFGNMKRANGLLIFQAGQIVTSAGTSFMHGAQDGQKFIGIFVIAIFLEEGGLKGETFIIPIWLMVLCAVFMTVGTIFGGIRIQKSTGLQKVKLEKYQGFSVDFSTACTLLTASLMGIPVSTNHTKIASILGVEGAKGFFSIDMKMMRIMLYSIGWTYVGCSLISVFVTFLFLRIF